MAETRIEAIRRLEDLRRKLMYSTEEEGQALLERFQLPVSVLTHQELMKLTMAMIRHASPEQVKKVLDEVLISIKP